MDVHFDELDDKIALLLCLCAKVLTDDLADVLAELFWLVYFAQKQGILWVVEELVFVVTYVLVHWTVDLPPLKSVVEQRKDALEQVLVIYSDVEVVEALNEADQCVFAWVNSYLGDVLTAVVVYVLEYSERALLDYAGCLVVVLLFCLGRADVAEQRSDYIE